MKKYTVRVVDSGSHKNQEVFDLLKKEVELELASGLPKSSAAKVLRELCPDGMTPVIGEGIEVGGTNTPGENAILVDAKVAGQQLVFSHRETTRGAMVILVIDEAEKAAGRETIAVEKPPHDRDTESAPGPHRRIEPVTIVEMKPPANGAVGQNSGAL